MATISSTFYTIILWLYPITLLCSTVVEDLKNLHPPPDFNTTIMNNCQNNPSLRYCNSYPYMNIDEIFKYSIVASHLCNESKNPNCVESFDKVDIRNRPNIASLYLSFDFFWKYCPLSIVSIDISNNYVKGSFPNDVLHCTQIKGLDLSMNEFFGEIPIQSFSLLTNLTFLNLSYNCFSESEELSDSEFFKRFSPSSFIDSGAIFDHKKFTLKVVLLLISFPIFVILIVIFLGWVCFQRPDFLPRKFQKSGKFTPAMLKVATCGFSTQNLVGKSDFVHIYKGILRDGTEVKIEMYWDNLSRESYNKFVEECKVLSELDHKNLVKVLGWCKGRKFRAIITEWIEEENVEMWLLGSFPTWKHRLRVLIGVLECMCYLQDEWPEVDYDLNTNSVLLSNNMEPLISRFKVRDQQVNNDAKISKFGVFMLEMILSKKVQEHSGFIKNMRNLHSEDLVKMIDERMEVTETNNDHVKEVISLGLLCINQSSSSEKPSLAMIFNTIATAYKASIIFPFAKHRMLHGDRSK
ncbi:hypothetical protein Lal_00011225 [Lupinus albus]|nr:hypothetical protein Lal_00011225 [Lupinus albus]